MTCLRFKIWLSAAVLALMSGGCTGGEDIPEALTEGEVFNSSLRIGVSSMTLNESSRALSPMNPDEERYVRTIALFEFDNEGLHQKNSHNYHFIDFTQGTLDGVPNPNIPSIENGVVESSLEGIPLEARSRGTICLVANVTEEEVDAFYDTYREEGQSYGRMTFEMFQTWSMPFIYKRAPEGVYDESVSGHLQNIYMFGYYQGAIDPAATGEIPVDLGRLASRIDVTIYNATGADIVKRLGYHFDKVCTSAYFFPLKMGMPPSDQRGLARTVVCSGVGDPVEGDTGNTVQEILKNDATHTRYFYVAAHSATDFGEATKLHIFYDQRIVDDSDLPDPTEAGVLVPLCNVSPFEAASVTNGYSLSRNTRYHFIIRLVQRKEAARSRSLQALRRGYEYMPDGVINVYLP